jgi:hypothetical protein
MPRTDVNKIDPNTKLTRRLAKKLNANYNSDLYKTVGELNALRDKIKNEKIRQQLNVSDVRRESNRTVKSGYGDDKDGTRFDSKTSVGIIKGPDKGTYSALATESGGFGENKDNFKKVYTRYEPSTLKPLREGQYGPQQGKPERSYASGTLGKEYDFVGGYGKEGLLNRPLGVSSQEIVEAQNLLREAGETYNFSPTKRYEGSGLKMMFKNKNK